MIGSNYNIAIFGIGHMGLPTAALLANKDFKVIGISRNKDKIAL